MSEHDEEGCSDISKDDGYAGPSTLIFGTDEVKVEVELRGYFQPIDGRYHWYGRVKQNDEITTRVEAGARTALLRTPTGQAEGTLTDPDPWGRYRIGGISTPPYKIEEPA